MRLSALLAASVGLAGIAAPPASAANNPGTGDSGFFTFRPADGIGGTQINVASGNALVRTRDLADGPLTYHVVVDRFYNSLDPDSYTILSPRWGFDVGPDTKLTVESNQDATVRGPSGYRIRFARQSDGSYVAPEGFDGSLAKTPSGWTLSRASANDEFGFDGSGNLTWTKDSSLRDFTVQGTSAAGRTILSSYGTNSGRRVNLSYTTSGDYFVRLMDNPASGHHWYRYSGGRLSEYESPTGAITSYGYDSNGFLDEIVEPGGTTVELDVLSSGKVNSITTTLPGGVPQTTSFVYSRRTYKTDVTAPDTTRRTHAYDDDWRVTRHYDSDVVPTVTPTGELFDLANDYVGPNRTYPVSVTADQPDGAGLRRLSVEQEDGTEIEGEDVPCTSTPFDLVCPTAFAADLDVDFSSLPEGALTIRAAADDDEEHHATSDGWSVFVDKTPPVFAAGPSEDPDEETAEAVLASDSTDDASMVTWPAAEDPELADGSPGSDVDHYRWRYRASSSASWSAWVTTPDENTDGYFDGALSHVELQVIPVDRVGNAGAAEEWVIDEAPQDDAPVPDYVPNPAFYDDPDFEDWEESEGLVEDMTAEPEMAARGGITVINKRYQCKQAWTPIQGTPSGWVVGNCSKDTRISAYRQRTFTKDPGSPSEGQIWVASSLPDGASFKGCGWISTAEKRLTPGGTGSGNALCQFYNHQQARVVRRATRRAGVPDSSSVKYPRDHIWATRKQNEVTGVWEEKDGHPAEVTQACRAYANIHPWRKNQTASGASTNYVPGAEVRIRYLSRYQARNPSDGNAKRYWIMTHTRDKERPWMWLPETCKFKLIPTP